MYNVYSSGILTDLYKALRISMYSPQVAKVGIPLFPMERYTRKRSRASIREGEGLYPLRYIKAFSYIKLWVISKKTTCEKRHWYIKICMLEFAVTAQ